MRILFTITNMTKGGSERVISILSKQFAAFNHEVGIMATKTDDVMYPISFGVKYIPIYADHKSAVLDRFERIIKIYKKVSDFAPDYILAFLPESNYLVIPACLFIKAKLIVSERSNPYLDPHKKIKRVVRDFLYRFVNYFVFQTEDAMIYYKKKIKKNGVVIPNPLDCRVMPEVHKGIRRREIVAVGRLNAEKNFAMLIDCFADIHCRYPDVTLTIYGNGPLKDELEQQIRSRGLEESVSMPGVVNNIHERIVDSMMFISTSNYEGISNSMLEALALGLPVISTDCPIGGARMFIRPYENGILFPVKDKAACIRAMLYMIQNPQEASRMGEKALDIRHELAVDKIGEMWISYMESI